jgi:hypothetical protein
MPEPLHPPYVAGALTIPRTLIRWLDVNPQNGSLTRVETFITLPPFTGNGEVWNGFSDIVTSFNSEAPNNFSIHTAITTANPNYTLCISFRVGGQLTRYIIWLATGSKLPQTIPMYNGQPIKKNFRFEVWNTSQGNAVQITPITFYTSVAGNIDYRYGADTQLVGNDGQVTNFTDTSGAVTPPYPSNVVCDLNANIGLVQSGGTLTWQNRVTDNFIFTTASITITVASPSNEVVVPAPGYVTGRFYSNQIAILMLMPSGTGTFYNTGIGGISVNYNSTTQVLTALGAGAGPLNVTPGTWIIIIVDSVTGVVYVINALTMGIVLQFQGVPIASYSGTVTTLGTGIVVGDPNALQTQGTPITTQGQGIDVK